MNAKHSLIAVTLVLSACTTADPQDFVMNVKTPDSTHEWFIGRHGSTRIVVECSTDPKHDFCYDYVHHRSRVKDNRTGEYSIIEWGSR